MTRDFAEIVAAVKAPERMVEVRYDYREAGRFRHPPRFVRWRPDRAPRLVHLRAARAAGAFDLIDVLEALKRS